MGEGQVIELLTKIFSTYNLFLIVASFLLNPLVIIVCLKSKRLRRTSTFKLLAFSSVNDMLVMIGWNQESFTNAFFKLYPYTRSVAYCRLVSVFIQFSSLEFESWMLVSISLDRLLTMSVKKWSKHYFVGVLPFIYTISLATLIAVTNLISIFTGGFAFVVNGTEAVQCFQTPPNFETDWYHIMSQIFVYFGYITPLSLLLIFNLIIIYKATRFSRSQRTTYSSAVGNVSRKIQMTRMILFITFLYIATSLPGIIVTGWLFADIISLEAGVLITNLLNCILFSYPALNFFTLFLSNKLFADEAKTMLTKLLRRKRVSHASNIANSLDAVNDSTRR